MSVYRLTRAQRLKREIEWFATTNPFGKPDNEHFDRHWTEAMDQLSRLSPDIMTQEMVAKRWPRILTALIVRSLGYFTAQSAANALLCFKLGRPFGCEWYCASAGFERNGWPSDKAEYDHLLLDVGRQIVTYSVSTLAQREYLRRDSRWAYARAMVDELAQGNRVRELAGWF